MKSSGDAIDLFGGCNFHSSETESTSKALVVLGEALLAIAESNREIAEANNRIATAIESLDVVGPYATGPLSLIADAMRQIAENGK